MSQNVNGLIQSAVAANLISQQASAALNVVNFGSINQDMGIGVDDVNASEVLLVTVIIDDSSSIEAAGNTQLVCDGHNMLIDALLGSKSQEGVLMMGTMLNDGLFNPYNDLNLVKRLDLSNYHPHGVTPLYDRTMSTLKTVLAKYADFTLNNAVPCRTITVIVTDGADVGSHESRPSDIEVVVKSMLSQESHIIAAIGIDDGGMTDFVQVFTEMGLPRNWILTPGNSLSEIRKAFQVVSQSAQKASQGAQSFSQTKSAGLSQVAGGFGI